MKIKATKVLAVIGWLLLAAVTLAYIKNTRIKEADKRDDRLEFLAECRLYQPNYKCVIQWDAIHNEI